MKECYVLQWISSIKSHQCFKELYFYKSRGNRWTLFSTSYVHRIENTFKLVKVTLLFFDMKMFYYYYFFFFFFFEFPELVKSFLWKLAKKNFAAFFLPKIKHEYNVMHWSPQSFKSSRNIIFVNHCTFKRVMK